ncbi:hypothetical protein CsSME_00039321 [Camellia sinensis var. sinensis]
MALVSGGRSTLNPNAPLFIPAAVRQVEDFSPEWWELVTTASWFRDYWLSQQQGEDGLAMDAEAMMKNLSLSKSLKEKSPRSLESARYWEKPAKCVSPKSSTRRIQQPR